MTNKPKSDPSKRTIILRWDLMFMIFAYSVPFSYIITCYYTSPLVMFLTLLWLILLGFISRNVKEEGFIILCHNNSWLISYVCAAVDAAGRVSPANPIPEEYRVNVTIISVIIWLLHEVILRVIRYYKKKKETEN